MTDDNVRRIAADYVAALNDAEFATFAKTARDIGRQQMEVRAQLAATNAQLARRMARTDANGNYIDPES